jgi:hypothetical protein
MSVLKTIFLLIFFFVLKSNVSTQVCKNFNQSAFCIIPEAYSYNQYEKSRSSYILIRKINKYEVVLNDNKEYKIGVCAPRGYEPIQFLLREKETGTVLFDNSSENNINYVAFSVNDKPITIIIEINILATNYKPDDKRDLRTCLGILIMYQKINKNELKF